MIDPVIFTIGNFSLRWYGVIVMLGVIAGSLIVERELKRRRKLNEYPTEELPETPGDTDAMRGTELRAVLWQALARLPELQRTMLVLRYYEGRTDPEIAEILDISVGTVKSSIWRSLRRLREDEVLSFGRDEEDAFGELVA